MKRFYFIIKFMFAILLSLLNINFINANHKRYKKIAIIAWGSLIKAPRNLEYEGEFKKTDITFPIELSCLSFRGTERQKLTRIIDKQWGHPMALWRAHSKNRFLSQALDNLAKREYTTRKNIFYIKTVLPSEKPNSNELVIFENQIPLHDLKGNSWYILKKAVLQLSQTKIVELAKWATTHKYDAVIWTGYTMAHDYDRAALIHLLKSDSTTLNNTKEYILISPDLNELTQFEQNILNDDL